MYSQPKFSLHKVSVKQKETYRHTSPNVYLVHITETGVDFSLEETVIYRNEVTT